MNSLHISKRDNLLYNIEVATCGLCYPWLYITDGKTSILSIVKLILNHYHGINSLPLWVQIYGHIYIHIDSITCFRPMAIALLILQHIFTWHDMFLLMNKSSDIIPPCVCNDMRKQSRILWFEFEFYSQYVIYWSIYIYIYINNFINSYMTNLV